MVKFDVSFKPEIFCYLIVRNAVLKIKASLGYEIVISRRSSWFTSAWSTYSFFVNKVQKPNAIFSRDADENREKFNSPRTATLFLLQIYSQRQPRNQEYPTEIAYSAEWLHYFSF